MNLSEWFDNQKKQSINILKFLQERIEKTNPRRELTADETKRLNKLVGIADRLRRGENVQNRQLQTWISEDEYAQLKQSGKSNLNYVVNLKTSQAT